MEGKFIYVFDVLARDMLLANGYKMLKETDNMCIFENKSELKFEMNGMSCLYSDTLTF